MTEEAELTAIVKKSDKPDIAVSAVNATADSAGAPPQEPPEFIRVAQIGDLARMKEILQLGLATPEEVAPDGTTALHWAAVNNRLTLCQYLMEAGAQVDVKGGELQATPLHWACRNGLVYIVHLLIQHGADPLRTDTQGFNALHLATHSSNVMLVIYLLHQGLPVDFTDPSGRTAMHWAAYQGDSLTVDVLLKWGADVKIRDTLGFTALHWAIVRGSKPCMKRLIEEGSDVFAKSDDGKSCRTMAEEMRTLNLWEEALLEAGRLANGPPRMRYLSEKWVKILCFTIPIILVPFVFGLFAYMPWYGAISLSILAIYGSLKVLNGYIVPNAYWGHYALLRTPFLAGVFFSSALTTIIYYLFYIAPVAFSQMPLVNIFFVMFFSIALYSFFATMAVDPGYVPKLSGINQQKEVIEDLIEKGEYDSKHFCIATFIAKPLRSKYDRSSGRVVAKFDHYCPWVNNAVGARNHRVFVVYVLSLFLGISTLFWIFFGSYIPTLEQICELEERPSCSILDNAAFGLNMAIWDGLQLCWVTMLSFVQLTQIARSVTSNEAANLHKFGYMGADDFSSLPADHSKNAAAEHGAPVGGSHHQSSYWSTAFKLLGVDQFVNTAQDTIRDTRSWKEKNPTDHGIVRNCTDFWIPGGHYNILKIPENAEGAIGGHEVNYYQLWDLPDREYARVFGSSV